MTEPNSATPDMTADRADLVEVRMLAVPVPLWARAQEQVDELLREFTLIAGQRHEGDPPEIPVRLLALVEDLTAGYGGFSAAQEALLAAAAAARKPEIDLTYRLPPGAAAAATQLGELLDQADEYCRGGEYLLTLATPPDLVRFRNWYLGEFIRQVEGHAPTPWPQYQS